MEACPPVARFARLDSFITEAAVVVFARTTERPDKTLRRIRDPRRPLNRFMIFHRFLSARRPFPSRIGELFLRIALLILISTVNL